MCYKVYAIHMASQHGALEMVLLEEGEQARWVETHLATWHPRILVTWQSDHLVTWSPPLARELVEQLMSGEEERRQGGGAATTAECGAPVHLTILLQGSPRSRWRRPSSLWWRRGNPSGGSCT